MRGSRRKFCCIGVEGLHKNDTERGLNEQETMGAMGESI